MLAGCGRFEENELALASLSEQERIESEPAGPLDVDESQLEVMHMLPEGVSTGNFVISDKVYRLANGPAQKWNGCAAKARVMGGFNSDTACGPGYFHPKFAAHLETNFFACTQAAASKAGLPVPEQIYLRNLGTYANRNGRGMSVLSMHAYARAIDIAKIILADGSGKLTHVNLHVNNYRGANAVFYDTLRSCWKATMPKACKPGLRESVGSIGHPKSVMGGNRLHDNHIHLSFPFCAG